MSESQLQQVHLPQLDIIEPADRLLLCGEPGHWRTAALAYGAARAGADVLVLDRFCARTALTLLDLETITLSDWYPWQLAEVLRLPKGRRDGYVGANHRAAFVGGARTGRGLKEALVGWWGDILFEHLSGPDWPGWCVTRVSLGSAHPESVGCWQGARSRSAAESGDSLSSLMVLGPEDEPRGWGQIGRLVICPPHLGGQTQEPRSLIATDLLGFATEDGLVYPLGPLRNALSSEFGWVSPFEAERVLESHRAVEEVALLALDSTQAMQLGLGAGFYAVARLIEQLQPGTPLLEIELLDYCRRQLSEIKCPVGVLFVPQLPRAIGGDVDLAALASLLVAAFEVPPPVPV